jgi:Tfp pilus assembly protein PilV
MARPARRSRGVSVIEAMVSLAVMAFGTLAVLGVHTGLRLSADIAKQRSEGVRIAQEEIEALRAYTDIDDYTNLVVSANAVPVQGYTTNTTYTIDRTVTDAQTSLDAPHRKLLEVRVSWKDRNDVSQSVTLTTSLLGTPPELAGSLLVPAEAAATRRPMGRNPAIPPQAVNQNQGSTSLFTPPGQSTEQWVFNNVTGLITELCQSSVCIPYNARLLAGYIRFELPTTSPRVAPGPGSTTIPGPTPAFVSPSVPGVPGVPGVQVVQTAPLALAGTRTCFTEVFPAYVSYYCALPVGIDPGWSGRSLLTGLSPLASSVADADVNAYRVCRYTPIRFHGVVPADLRNDEHPLDYTAATLSLANQNFLVIWAGDGSNAFTCPGDDTSFPLNTNTWHHQPPV